MSGVADAVRDGRDGAVVVVRVQPGASRPGWAGLHGRALRLRVAAPPERGRANEAVRREVAGALGVDVRSVRLLSGGRGRDKRLEVDGLDADQAVARLERAGVAG